ncbi:MarR family transcriptional regulator [Corynebacterium silvaticum]|uniref:MarR family winged helix-turn-helix transcriptional regulator n=1 Tax=Corynebacterium silvaticum TaxID=2320431 RepID=UPI001068CA80|nr:MarR family transcriptional regulator [Corynebacterium silvaticum]MBH5299832.1 MarR family transcriptional regulator [Corynebacterium silvaticum]TFA91543.1 MarR family transcriptional regulator [Corynebacterium silvaticum]TFA92595.1 MarR family transcriptional regulator [Corynebacterium silvaticum]TNX78736.1 MarR family transcriptional regulator [Corynebacterium silvaticum]TRM17693.1 MarR family transcriptional regulator [Corynebacterium silvaticum]
MLDSRTFDRAHAAPLARTTEGDALTALVLPAFELSGEFLEAAALITRPHNLTPARWQVLGTTLTEPLPVAEIARRVGRGLARQSVQRVADDLVAAGWATWRPNPNHRRAKLLEPTTRGRDTVSAIEAEQHRWANAVGGKLEETDLKQLNAIIRRVIDASRLYREKHSS